MQMFPGVPHSAIDEDLAYTGNLEETCENILTGRIRISPVSLALNPTSSSSSSSSIPSQSSQPSSSSSSTTPYPLGLNFDPSTPLPETPPPKFWESEAGMRNENLRLRKQYMVQEARQKFLEKSGKGKSKVPSSLFTPLKA